MNDYDHEFNSRITEYPITAMPSFTIMASTAVVRIPNPLKHVTITNVLQVIISIFAAYIYLFGIPQEYKRAMEEKALETMGENKASCRDCLNPCLLLC